MKTLYFILALAIGTLGVVSLFHGDMGTFRYSIIMSMLFNIYAKLCELGEDK